ncbi:MAG: hypothetical protein ILP01_03300 [Clostridia bacterium]|nr:hypothetical protein [Clostridia bacterium]
MISRTGGQPGRRRPAMLSAVAALFAVAVFLSSCGTAFPATEGELPGLSADASAAAPLEPVESVETEDTGNPGVSASEAESSMSGPAGSGVAVTETAAPETTGSVTTVPETTVPETTVNETTAPETTVPETTVADTTVAVTTAASTRPPSVTTSKPAATTSPAETAAPSESGSPTIVFLPTGGYFVYGQSAYVTASYSSTQQKIAGKYRQVAEKYAELFPGTRVSVMLAPCSAVMLADDEYAMTKTANQVEILARIEALYEDSPVTFINISDRLFEHRDEYLYLRTDHHWNSLGAYYAYCEFIETTGMTASPITAYKKSYVRKNYVGSIYNYNKTSAKAAVLKTFPDIIESYESQNACTMTIRKDGGAFLASYNTAIFNTESHSGGIASFAGGDRPFVHINVPENPQDLSILILKDSYADQFAPFLIENYGNIYIIDPRYNSTKKLYDQFKDVGLDDILFLNNLQVGNSNYWQNAYGRMIGFTAK